MMLSMAFFASGQVPRTARARATLSLVIRLGPFLTLFIFDDPKYLGREIVDPGACGRGRFCGHNVRLSRRLQAFLSDFAKIQDL